MRKAILTVVLEGAPEALDLELPADVDAAGLARRIAEAFGTAPDEFEMVAHPPGRPLAPTETLAAAGAWDGAWLVLKPKR